MRQNTSKNFSAKRIGGGRTVFFERKLLAARSLKQSPAYESFPAIIVSAIIEAIGTGLCGIALGVYLLGYTDLGNSIFPVGSAVVALGCIPLLGEALWYTKSRKAMQNHCALCKFYQSDLNKYTSGICGLAEPRPVSQEDCCSHFVFSERAMVKELVSRSGDISHRN